MKKLICFLIGHRLDLSNWMEASIPKLWYRELNCTRCGELVHRQIVNRERKPLDVI